MAKPYLHCHQFGSGGQVLIAFHGFGQDGTFFAPLQQAMPQYTIYAIDLFFHGKSHWADPTMRLTKNVWRELLNNFLATHHISEFDLMGFSMGGRIALVTYELFAAQINRLWLLAPDGIKSNAWYRVATRNCFLQGLFRYVTAEDKNLFHYGVQVLEKHQLLHPTLAKIAQQQMRTPALRRRVYNTWMLYRYLEPHLSKIAGLVRQYRPQVHIITGEYDRVIRPQYMQKLTRLLGDLCTHQTFACGHQGLLNAWLHQQTAAKDA
ncbi:MAG: alpha/beta hydrolase [Cytophagales bacterium]|nr:alpha/beta hydrolase [Bernardetiaceae bacterium]MDW8205003.1 alpha/beta hydrolase [Cytophagales bacterium]